MKIGKLILAAIRKIEEIQPGIIVFAYRDSNSTQTNVWWEIAVSDYKFYTTNKHFLSLAKAWRKAAAATGNKLIFVCCTPTDKRIEELYNQDNIIVS